MRSGTRSRKLIGSKTPGFLRDKDRDSRRDHPAHRNGSAGGGNWTTSGNGEAGGERPIKPDIIIEADDPEDGLGKWSDQVLAALKEANKPAALFQKGGSLVRRRRPDPDNPMILERMSHDALRGSLGRVAHWGQSRVNKKGRLTSSAAHPPPAVW